jgi:O-antigen/teichoic acid export membrane protein
MLRLVRREPHLGRRLPSLRLALIENGLLRGTAWMSYAYVGGLIIQGLYFVGLARLLGANGLGAFAGALAFVDVLAPFAGWGAGNLLVMRTARDHAQFATEFGTSLIVFAISALAIVALAVSIGLIIFAGSSLARLIIPLALAEIACGQLATLAGQAFQACERLRETAHLTMLPSVLRLVALGLFAIDAAHPRAAVERWCYYYCGAALIAAICAMVVAIYALGRPALGSFDRFRQVRDGFFFALGQASKSIYVDIDKTMLSILRSQYATGVYTAGYRLIGMAFAPVQALVFSSNTRLFRLGEGSTKDVWRNAVRLFPAVALYSIAVGVALVLMAPLLPVILGRSFDSSVTVIRLLAPLPLLQGTHYLFGDSLMGAGRQGFRSMVQLVIAVANIALNLWLIRTYSWTGAVVATLACEGAMAVWFVLCLSRAARDRASSAEMVGA